MPTLFFMQWCQVKDAVQVGSIRVLPYARAEAPAPLGKTSQAALDGILGNYADPAYHPTEDSTTPVRAAAILRWPEDDEREDLLSGEEIEARFQQVQLVVFAALSYRDFGMDRNYCNADMLAVTAQHFSEDNPATTMITTRRRDGQGQHIVSGSRGKPIFLRPLHVSDRYKLTMDGRFIEVLLALPHGDVRSRVLEAAQLFNRANTDANEVMPAAEIVFLRAALETLVGATHRADDLQAKLLALMEPHLGPAEWHDVEILPAIWQKMWPKDKRPFAAWVNDFCAWRNKSAHGKGPIKYEEPVWSLENHLLFTSWFMSRVVKCLLVREGLYALTQDDHDELQNIELFFTYDIREMDGTALQWSKVLNHIQHLQLARTLYEATKDGF